MSLNTLAQANADQDLRTRVNACCQEQARTDQTYSPTALAELIRRNRLDVIDQFQWIVALAGQAAYAYAVGNGVEHPGRDEGVITDADIAAAVQTNWNDVQEMFA